MRTILASTAILIGGAGIALADAHTISPFVERLDTAPLRTTDLMGARVYRVDRAVDPALGLQDDWDDIGEVSDVAVGPRGGVDVLLADIGGFLGLGEKTVALDIDQVQILRDPGDGEVSILLTAAREMLDDAPLFVDTPYDSDALSASPGPETTPLVDGDADDARTAATVAVDNEGSGLTTQSSVDLEANRSGAPTTPMNDQMMEGSTTNVPTLDEGTVVDNPQTPATAVITDGRVTTETDAGVGAPEEMTENDPNVDLGMAESEATVSVNTGRAAVDMAAPEVERAGSAPLLRDEIVLPQIEGIDVYDLDDERSSARSATPSTRPPPEAAVPSRCSTSAASSASAFGRSRCPSTP